MSSPVFEVREHVMPCQHIREYSRATGYDQEEVLNVSVKQYVPLDNPNPQPGDVTFIGAHACGFPKELYEPLYEEIHARAKVNGFRIRGIFIADMANQGMSGVLNENVLGNDPSWMDHPRDLLHMINHFRPPRPLVGIGHSMGSNNLVNLALIHPRLFTTLVLMEPVIQRHSNSDPRTKETGRQPARMSTFRRDLWPSHDAAVAAFSKQKFYQQWDPRVLQRWLKFGIRDTPTPIYPNVVGGATLTTTKHQEVFSFLRPMFNKKEGVYDLATRTETPDINPDLGGEGDMKFYRPEPPNTFSRLPQLRPSALYVFGELSDMSEPWAQADKLDNTGTGIGGSGGVKEGRVSGITLKGAGHLIAMEEVAGCADAMVPWIGKEIERWSKEEEAWKKWRDGKTAREKVTTSKEWEENIGGPFTRPSKEKL